VQAHALLPARQRSRMIAGTAGTPLASAGRGQGGNEGIRGGRRAGKTSAPTREVENPPGGGGRGITEKPGSEIGGPVIGTEVVAGQAAPNVPGHRGMYRGGIQIR